eukprot:g14964.t1
MSKSKVIKKYDVGERRRSEKNHVRFHKFVDYIANNLPNRSFNDTIVLSKHQLLCRTKERGAVKWPPKLHHWSATLKQTKKKCSLKARSALSSIGMQ